MTDFHKGLLDELVKDWGPEKIDDYITELELRQTELTRWIKHLKILLKSKVRKTVFDTGPLGGKG